MEHAILRRRKMGFWTVVSPLHSFIRVAAALAILSTAILEAFKLVSAPSAELGVGVIAGIALAAIAKAAHLA